MATEGPEGCADRLSYYKPGKAERWSSLMILFTLAGVAVGIGIKQRFFNPAVVEISAAVPTGKVSAEARLLGWLPPELQPLGNAESFGPDNLYDKIDGKAELYLAAGFQQLRCQRFALSAAPDQWFEWFVYDMGSLPHAFSAFSTQRRAEGQPLSVTPYGYKTQNSMYFVAGNYYVEALGSAASAPLTSAILALAQRWVAAEPSSSARLPELDIFPPEDLVPNSQTLEVVNAFGFDQFTNVFTAQYKVQSGEVTAFITWCANGNAAQTLRRAYGSFLLANGGKALRAPSTVGDRFEIMGGTELCFSEGSFVAGIHAATAVEACEKAGIGLTTMKTQGGGPIHAEDEADQKLGGHFVKRGFSQQQAKLKAVWENTSIASIWMCLSGCRSHSALAWPLWTFPMPNVSVRSACPSVS